MVLMTMIVGFYFLRLPYNYVSQPLDHYFASYLPSSLQFLIIRGANFLVPYLTGCFCLVTGQSIRELRPISVC